ncbi:MAG: hypothetical protein EBR45_11055, partial [Betaproteobacteria bacterium]|nr:hypothetical protein [Betaproteobacteria bacterium]
MVAQLNRQKDKRQPQDNVGSVSARRRAIQDQGLESPSQYSEQLFKDDDCKHCRYQKAVAQDDYPLKTG